MYLCIWHVVTGFYVQLYLNVYLYIWFTVRVILCPSLYCEDALSTYFLQSVFRMNLSYALSILIWSDPVSFRFWCFPLTSPILLIAYSIAGFVPSNEFDGFRRMNMPTQQMENRFGVGLVASVKHGWCETIWPAAFYPTPHMEPRIITAWMKVSEEGCFDGFTLLGMLLHSLGNGSGFPNLDRPKLWCETIWNKKRCPVRAFFWCVGLGFPEPSNRSVAGTFRIHRRWRGWHNLFLRIHSVARHDRCNMT